MTDYTRPEKGTELAIARSVREAVKECGGCCYCKHKAALFETIGRRAVCGLTPPRAFPRCLDELGGFEFDEALYDGRLE